MYLPRIMVALAATVCHHPREREQPAADRHKLILNGVLDASNVANHDPTAVGQHHLEPLRPATLQCTGNILSDLCRTCCRYIQGATRAAVARRAVEGLHWEFGSVIGPACVNSDHRDQEAQSVELVGDVTVEAWQVYQRLVKIEEKLRRAVADASSTETSQPGALTPQVSTGAEHKRHQSRQSSDSESRALYFEHGPEAQPFRITPMREEMGKEWLVQKHHLDRSGEISRTEMVFDLISWEIAPTRPGCIKWSLLALVKVLYASQTRRVDDELDLARLQCA
ncbi:hypothetical protein PSPO01_07058 [Paraphaeosphaeria sporulosa]